METASDDIPDRLVAALADKYRLEREIGAGGSATVYLAEDLKHHRRVAIKVLKPQVAAALGPERFEDEVRIAAGLNHPHILNVYDSGEADGVLYYVMPYVDGQSLRDRLAEGLLPFHKVAKILAEVADALAYAHAAGIVHRDIKPENILYNGKHVVVTDFGIAKAISEAADRKSSTSMGIALGTPAYMAPEQAASDPSLDHRADLYSLGIVGYELLVGHPPFSGSAQQILTSHLTTKPEPIHALREAVPPALASVVMRALAKAPAERWPSAEAMQAQLETLAGTTSNSGLMATVVLAARRSTPTRPLAIGLTVAALLAIGVLAWTRLRPAPAAPAPAVAPAATPTSVTGIPDIATDPSIAVLPFENMSSDKEQAYFSDGISEELLNLLAKIPELRVIARTSSFQFRDQDIGIKEIARKLNVAAVLEGSVRKSGDKVRITVQLVRAKDGTHLWSETYDRTLEDVFKVQDEIAREVVDKLKLTLLAAAPKARPVDAAVYPMLLQADAMYLQGAADARRRALELYQRITAMRPGEARAWLGLARARLNDINTPGVDSKQSLQLAREAANKALAIDPTLGLAHSYLAAAFMIEGNLPSAAREYQLSFQKSPTEPRVLANLARMLAHLGRHQEAIQAQRPLVLRDPATAQSQFNLCSYFLGAGQLKDAEDACRTGLLLTPDYTYGNATLSQVLLQSGKFDAALKQAQLEAVPGSRLVQTAKAFDALGRRAESEKALQDMIENHLDGYVFGPAEVYAHRGDANQAFAWLERARREDDPEIGTAHVNHALVRLHEDPRWLPFLRKVGTAPEQLAKIVFDPKLPG